MSTSWLIAFAAPFVDVLLLWAGKTARQTCGLTNARTLNLDRRHLFSRRLGLAGRPDRVMSEGGVPIPEEWKSGGRVYDSQIAQTAAYFILIEEETGVQPPHGFISLAIGERVRIENTDHLRAWVVDVADQIRAARRQMAEII